MDSREVIDREITSLKLEEKISLVSLHKYEPILKEVISRFTTLGKGAESKLWLWENFKEPIASAQPYDAIEMLRALVPPNEQVWFIAEDFCRTKKNGNFWLYEGTVGPICTLLDNLQSFELYLASKKYEWLLCINHHQVVIASGGEMPEKLIAA
ncbi:MAG: hypothetical protein Q7T36_12910 [Fluviicoccus sp.]|uniref:DUF6756 family protein n=1 Tax=Fluviicoccus sp. TaxID=2003552 RepID=UPI002715ABE1|nr:DUF6756 family protein [Fluviicoccus sp.]MDO8331357.1 hypothetical protein [Fluviicoccus sp.]